ncbi:MAG TPA: hypothetical protein VKT73_16710 [Xanthobacteraceae bacterium]|nr:hypothetical protein [Xanthobacteraceae bacterium]
MKLGIAVFAVFIFCCATAQADCKVDEEIELSGIIGEMTRGDDGWILQVGHLNKEILACDLSDLFGQATDSPWYLLTLKSSSRKGCSIGSLIRATLKLTEDLGGYGADVITWQCQ